MFRIALPVIALIGLAVALLSALDWRFDNAGASTSATAVAASPADAPSAVIPGSSGPSEIERALIDRGYGRIEFIDRVLPVYIVEACKGDRRLRLDLNRIGKIRKSRPVGTCSNEAVKKSLSVVGVEKVLRRIGYRRVAFYDRHLPIYVAYACWGDEQFRLRVDHLGNIANRRHVGLCGERIEEPEKKSLSPAEIRVMLQQQGMTEIGFRDQVLPVYVLDGCRVNQRWRIRIDRLGDVIGQWRIGHCGAALVDVPEQTEPQDFAENQPSESPEFADTLPISDDSVFDSNIVDDPAIVETLPSGGDDGPVIENIGPETRRQTRPIAPVEPATDPELVSRPEPVQPVGHDWRHVRDELVGRGWSELEFTDRTGPLFALTACRDGTRSKLAVDDRIKILRRQHRGICAPTGDGPRYSWQEVRDQLKRDGWRELEVVNRTPPGYEFRGCRDGRRYGFAVAQDGRIGTRTDVGRCGVRRSATGLSWRDIRDHLANLGWRDMSFSNRTGPSFELTGCYSDNKEYLVTITDRARIRRQTRIGRCEPVTGERLTDDIAEPDPEPDLEPVVESKPEPDPVVKTVTLRWPGAARRLKAGGWYDLRWINQTPLKLEVEACRNSSRYKLLLAADGSVMWRDWSGPCMLLPEPRRYSPAAVQLVLRDAGYDFKKFRNAVPPDYVAETCKSDRRYLVSVGRSGRVGDVSDIGTCDQRPAEVVLSDGVLRERLKKSGWSQIKILDKRLNSYRVQACKRQRRYQIKLNRRGNIVQQGRVGSCRSTDVLGTVRPLEVRNILLQRGYYNVAFIDNWPPDYIATACRSGRRYEIGFNRKGQVTSRTQKGRCNADLTNQGYSIPEMTKLLERRRYYHVWFEDREPPDYGVQACWNGRLFKIALNIWGEIQSRRQTDWCEGTQFEPDREVLDVRFTREEITENREIDARDCQMYLEYLLRTNIVLFDKASATVKDESVPLLNDLSVVAKRCPNTNIEIAGHTDSDGSEKYNERLSKSRAASVRRFMIKRGVSRRRLEAKGYGENRPITTNETDVGKSQNRRIEIVVSWDG